MKNQITMHQVESSNVKAIGHHHGDVLRVEFKSGGVFDYKGINQAQFEAIRSAESIGKAVNGFVVKELGIKGRKVVEDAGW